MTRSQTGRKCSTRAPIVRPPRIRPKAEYTPPPHPRHISWQVNDGALNSQTPNPDPDNLVNETVLHFDVAPTVDLDASGAGTGFTTTFTENGAPIAIVDTDASIVDPDNANLDTATIVLTNAKATDALSIAGALPGSTME